MRLLNNSDPPPDRLVEPKLGCLPVRKTLIVYSFVCVVLLSLLFLGFVSLFNKDSVFNREAQNRKLVEQSRQMMMQEIGQQLGQELGEWSKQYGTEGQQWGKAVGKAWEQQLGKGESKDIDMIIVALAAIGLALVFHICVAIGSIYYHDTVLRICQYICLAFMVCLVLSELGHLCADGANSDAFKTGASQRTGSGGLTLAEFICIKRLREFIARRKTTRDQAMA